jgi:hypothetical protein
MMKGPEHCDNQQELDEYLRSTLKPQEDEHGNEVQPNIFDNGKPPTKGVVIY